MDELFQRWMLEFARPSPQHAEPDLAARYGLASASEVDGKRYWALILAD